MLHQLPTSKSSCPLRSRRAPVGQSRDEEQQASEFASVSNIPSESPATRRKGRPLSRRDSRSWREQPSQQRGETAFRGGHLGSRHPAALRRVILFPSTGCRDDGTHV